MLLSSRAKSRDLYKNSRAVTDFSASAIRPSVEMTKETIWNKDTQKDRTEGPPREAAMRRGQ